MSEVLHEVSANVYLLMQNRISNLLYRDVSIQGCEDSQAPIDNDVRAMAMRRMPYLGD